MFFGAKMVQSTDQFDGNHDLYLPSPISNNSFENSWAAHSFCK